MTLVRAVDSMVDSGQLAPNELWQSWLHQIEPYLTALWPYEGYGASKQVGVSRDDIGAPEPPLTLLEKLYVPERRNVDRYHPAGTVPVEVNPVVALSRFLANRNERNLRVLLLTSGPGYGKTTFLHFFFKVYLKTQPLTDDQFSLSNPEFALDQNVVPIFIDGSQSLLGPEAGLLGKVHKRLDTALKQVPGLNSLELRKRVFWAEELALISEEIATVERASGAAQRELYELNEVNKLEADLEALNGKRVRYLSEQLGKLIVIVLDNLDQIPMANAREALAVAFQVAGQASGVRIICSVRDYTHPPTREHARLGAFEFEHLAFGPPPLRAVIERRLEHFIEKLGRMRLEASIPIGKVTVTRTKGELQKFVTEIRRYLLSDEVLELIDASSNHNVRLALQKVLTLLSSPYVETGELLIKLKSKRAHLRTSDAWRSLILARAAVMQPFSSWFINLFDNGNPRYALNSLVRMHVLQRLQGRTPGQTISFKRICEDLCSIGHEEPEIRTAIHGLVLAGVLETWDSPATNFKIEEVEQVAATKAGNYYRDIVSRKFDYLHWISLTTFMSEEYRVASRVEGGNIVDRLRRAAALVHHVAQIEHGLDAAAFRDGMLSSERVSAAMASAVRSEVVQVLHAPSLQRFREQSDCKGYLALLDDIRKGRHPPWERYSEEAEPRA